MPMEGATREEVLDTYHPLRAAVQRVLAAAPSACTRADLARAAALLGIDPATTEARERLFLTDLALFQPNARGTRPYDRFLKAAAKRLPPEDQEVARLMGDGFFSILRVAGRHPGAGLWLDDLARGGGRLWLVDESLEQSVQDGVPLAGRLFDAGPFHAGFGIFVPLEDEAASLLLDVGRATGAPLPGHRLAATIYAREIQTQSLLGLVEAFTQIGGNGPPRRRRRTS